MTPARSRFAALLTALVVSTAATALTGCGAEGPTAPPTVETPPPPAPIDPPRYLHLEKIQVRGFPKTKSNGKAWDLIGKKADIYVVLQRNGGYTGAFFSETKKNVDHDKTYTMTRPASIHDGELPFDIKMSHTYKVHLIDDDFGSTDKIGYVTVNPRSLYKNGARTFKKTITRKGVKIRIEGSWIY